MKFFRPLPTIRALSFDLDDTLYDNYPIMRRAEASLAEHMQTHYPQVAGISRQEWLSIKRQILRGAPELASDMGELRRKTLETGFSQAGLQEEALNEAVEDCFEHFYSARSDFRLNKNLYSSLQLLADKMPLVAITNGNVDLQQVGIASLFTHIFRASVERPMKPHRHMFKLTSESLDLPTEAILHVGDNLEKDVWGARRAGFSTAWFACNRTMELNRETDTAVLPDVQLDNLDELLQLI